MLAVTVCHQHMIFYGTERDQLIQQVWDRATKTVFVNFLVRENLDFAKLYVRLFQSRSYLQSYSPVKLRYNLLGMNVIINS